MRWLIGIIGLTLGVLGGCEAIPEIPVGEQAILVHDSVYHHLVVSQDDTCRYLRFGYGRVQGAMGLDDPVALKLPYTAYLALGLVFNRPRRVLMIGLAGGAMVRFLQEYFPDVNVDVVEIDPDVVAVAERYFGVQNAIHHRIHIGDGRVFVKQTRERYDWVILDGFHADTVPHHLTTVEFMEEVKGLLQPQGVVTANIARLGPGILYRSMIRTLAQVFPQVYLFPVPNRGNIVTVATLSDKRRSGESIAKDIGQLKARTNRALDLLEARGSLLEEKPVVVDAPVLTDDYAPVDLLRYQEGIYGF
jgi:spermidine synthase